ncbi:hypothetical protein KPL74_18270 [Bacillus sp. NP157]|nr:hypothetical protein KPL74_18270 [Bacillus sp. NP157]
MPPRDTYDDPTTGSGDPSHGQPPGPTEPVTTGSGDPQHKRDGDAGDGDVENAAGGSTPR